MRDPRYIEVLETLTKAWAKGRQVRLWYDSERSGEEHVYTFCPYFIEPYAIGQTTYVIGKLTDSDEIRTFKIQRIKKVELLFSAYSIPEHFDADDYLEYAWGIWTGDGEPVEVVLCFSSRVAKRVKETRWHRKQHLEDQADGTVIWRAKIAAPREMLPWVLGWGREVQVLKPDNLRDWIEREYCQEPNPE